MSWTRRNIRTISALLIALLAYAAIPHRHASVQNAAGADSAAGGHDAADTHDGAGAARFARSDAGPLATARLLADEKHESHSPGLDLDSHPCALCRIESLRAVATVQSERLRFETCESGPCDPDPPTNRPELLLAERHPARAPPRV